MAKLKAPLMSLGASGALGKALVFFGWKGLDCVREYVVPANPKSTAQVTHRAYITAAVTLLHSLQSLTVSPFAADDVTSYALLSSLSATPRTWFNTIVKQWIDQKVDSLIPGIYSAGSCTAGVLKVTLKMSMAGESSLVTNGFIHYGVSKTNMANKLDCTRAQLAAGREVTSLTAGTKYFFQYRPSLPITFLGTNSGIWYAVPTAV